MEKTNKRIIAIALILSLITAVLVYTYISGNTKTAAAPQLDSVTVFVAVRTIPARTEVTEADIKQVKIAKELVNANAIKDISEIAGKRTLESIIEGEQVMQERLASETTMSLSYFIPEGKRAVSFNVSEQINVANLVRPGDYVDVIASFEKEEEENVQTTKFYPRITKTILQNVLVLALGQDVKLSSEKLKDAPTTVTLAINKEDIEKFIFASEYGVLRLVLRPIGDSEQKTSQGIVRSEVTGNEGVYSQPKNIN